MLSKAEYSKIVKKTAPKSKFFSNSLKAFLVGGAICAVGQGLINLYLWLKIPENDSKTLASVTLIFLGILLTALHLYDRLAKKAGAGTLVPITGFANAMASPAIEFRSEGFVTGLGAKLFVIAGPVLVYGTTAAALWGLIYYLIQMWR